jgi:mono/diheme cytochrome c family protein
MQYSTRPTRLLLITVISAACLGLQAQLAAANDDPTEVAAAIVDKQYADQKMDVKRLFASRCSWCHQGYGMKQADGPRLAGIERSREEVIQQIAFGKTPMPGFRKQLKPYQIEALADYIKALPSGD